MNKEITKNQQDLPKVKKVDTLDNQRAEKISNRLKEKRERTPLHKQKRIGVKLDPAYYIRLVNDVDDNIDQFLEAGYDYIDEEVREGERASQDEKQMGKRACQSVGNGIKAYYMRIPIEQYEADQKDKQKVNDRIMTQIGYDCLDTQSDLVRGSVKVDTELKKSN